MVGSQVARVADATVSHLEDDEMKPCKEGLALFTARQVDVIQCSARGLRAKEIAEQLGVNRWTIQSHIREIYKAGAKSMAHAVAIHYGID